MFSEKGPFRTNEDFGGQTKSNVCQYLVKENNWAWTMSKTKYNDLFVNLKTLPQNIKWLPSDIVML